MSKKTKIGVDKKIQNIAVGPCLINAGSFVKIYGMKLELRSKIVAITNETTNPDIKETLITDLTLL